jgi:hypothetical protein
MLGDKQFGDYRVAMSDSRQALEKLISALERHYELISQNHGGNDEIIIQAVGQVEDAFLDYEEAIGNEFDEFLPLEIAEDE